MGKRWPLSRCHYRVWPMAHGTLRQCHVMHLTTCIGAVATKTKDTRRPHWALFRNERTEGKRPRDLRASFQHCCSQSSLNGRWVTSADPRWSLNESRLDLMPPFSLSLPPSWVQITFTAEKIAFTTPKVCFRRNLSSPLVLDVVKMKE